MTGLDLIVEPGERVLLAGPSGSGKSTVLRAIAGALGEAIAGDQTGDVQVTGTIGLLLQNPGDAVVAERIGRDVAFGPENLQVPREQIWERVRGALAAVALAYPLDRPTSALSGGELQRLALAGVLALRPGLLLLDEPTSMLDEDNAASVRRAVLDVVSRTGSSLVVVEHRLEPWLEHVDRVVTLSSSGEIVSDGPPGDFARDLRDELGASGVWMPGLPVPAPLHVPRELVEPRHDVPHLIARHLVVDLASRTIRGGVTAHALRGIDTELRPGGSTAFTGPSGAGKSTLVAAWAGLVRPSAGEVAGGRVPLHTMTSRELATGWGWVPQNPEHGFLARTVRDEVGATAKGLDRSIDVDQILEVFALTPLAGANPYRLSGGEQRRLAVAAALAHRPCVAALDEPTVGQDRRTWAAVTGWLTAAAHAGVAVAVATHDPDLVAVADHEVRLRAGQVDPVARS